MSNQDTQHTQALYCGIVWDCATESIAHEIAEAEYERVHDDDKSMQEVIAEVHHMERLLHSINSGNATFITRQNTLEAEQDSALRSLIEGATK